MCCGFLYDVSRDIECCSIDVVDHCVKNGKVLHRKPVVAVFKVCSTIISGASCVLHACTHTHTAHKDTEIKALSN